jgi:methionyl-tRNA synthetase
MSTDAPTGTPSASTPAPTAAAPAAGGPLPNIAYDLFAKLDLRVATVLSAEPHPNADKLLKIRLDDGLRKGVRSALASRPGTTPRRSSASR